MCGLFPHVICLGFFNSRTKKLAAVVCFKDKTLLFSEYSLFSCHFALIFWRAHKDMTCRHIFGKLDFL